jgi:putative ABC transport system substrate-binding protein
VTRRWRSTRRSFLGWGAGLLCTTVLAGCGLGFPSGGTRVPRLGYLHPEDPWSPGLRGVTETFISRLAELGYADGRTLTIDWRSAEGRIERLPALAEELVELPVDVILANGAAIPVVRSATAGIPIVFAAHSDPVGSGLVASLSRPGGNVTGMSSYNPALTGKRLEIIREIVPGLTRLAALWYAPQGTAATEARLLDEAAGMLGIQTQSLAVRDRGELAAAYQASSAQRAEALYVIAAPPLTDWRAEILELSAAHRIPSLYPVREFVESGGLLSYGVNVGALFHRAADLVAKILKGGQPADMPVEQPTTFDFAINSSTARAAQIAIPPTLLAQATEVIQ